VNSGVSVSAIIPSKSKINARSIADSSPFAGRACERNSADFPVLFPVEPGAPSHPRS
jgi:hypothetical protein